VYGEQKQRSAGRGDARDAGGSLVDGGSMNRSVLTPVVASSLLSLLAPCARALPSAWNSTVPGVIRLVGANGGVPDAVAGQFTVVVRDVANNPIAHAAVVIDYESCTDLAICADQLDTDATVNCAAKFVRKLADASGAVTFTILGHSNGAGGATTPANYGSVYANGVLIAHPSIAAFDLDGFGGVGAGDLSVWLSDFGSGMNWARSDYDGDGMVGAADLSEWLTTFGAGGSTQSCGASCP
jgi:hypothetical protein